MYRHEIEIASNSDIHCEARWFNVECKMQIAKSPSAKFDFCTLQSPFYNCPLSFASVNCA